MNQPPISSNHEEVVATDDSARGRRVTGRDSRCQQDLNVGCDGNYRFQRAYPCGFVPREYRENMVSNHRITKTPAPLQNSPGVSRKVPPIGKLDAFACLQMASKKTSKQFSSLRSHATMAADDKIRPAALSMEERGYERPAAVSSEDTLKPAASVQYPKRAAILSPPKPPPTSPFSQSPAWMSKASPASTHAGRKKMTLVTRVPSRRHLLQRSNSVRSGSTGIFSTDTSNYTAGDELASMSDFSESYLGEDENTELESVETMDPKTRVIAIGIISPPKTSPKTKAQHEQEHISEVVAKDIAEQEHNLKVKRREAGERRLSAPSLLGGDSMSETKRKARLSSTTTHIQPRISFLESLPGSFAPGVEEPSVTVADATGRIAKEDEVDAASKHPPPPPPIVVTPRLRARKSGGLTGSMTPTDRQEKMRAAMGAMRPSSRALPPPPRSHSINSPPSMPVRKYSAELAITSEENEEDKVDDDSSFEDTIKPSSLHSAISIGSGLDLDDEKRNSIIARRSTSIHARRLSRATRSSQMDEKALARTSFRSTHSMRSTASPAHSRQSSVEFASDTSEIATTVASVPKRRLCDEKEGYRITAPAAASPSTTARSRRPCDEKAIYRQNPSACLTEARHASASPRASAYLPDGAHHVSTSLPGVHAVTRARKEQQKGGGLLLAAGTAEAQAEQDARPFGPVTTSDVHDNDSDGEEDQDLEAQAGVPVILPGAFAVSTREQMGQPSSGYDSGFEDNSLDGSTDDEYPPVSAAATEEDPEEEAVAIFRPAVPDTPLQAELYEEHYAEDARVVLEGEDDSKKLVSRRVRFVQILSAFLVLGLIVGVTLTVLLTGKQQRPSCEDPCIPAVDGWSQAGTPLMGPTDRDNIQFGYSISMSGDGARLAIGLPGLDGEDEETMRAVGGIYIMDFNGSDWLTVHQIDGPSAGAEAGTTIALSEDGARVAIGSPKWGTQGGFVAVYEETNIGDWKDIGNITGVDVNGTYFGGSLGFSSDGKVLAVGDKRAATQEGIPDVGFVLVLQETNETWAEVGKAIHGENEGDLFGWSLSLSGNGRRLAASAIGADNQAGKVRTFDFDDESWVQTGSSLAGGTVREHFGSSVAISSDGTTLSIGATGYSREDEIGVGVVRAFRFESAEDRWTPMGEPVEGYAKFDALGTSVALSSSGDTLAVGGPDNDIFGDNAGHVQVMKFDGSTWKPAGSQIGSHETTGGRFGFSVALSADGKSLAGAAPFSNFDGFRSKVGQVWVFNANHA